MQGQDIEAVLRLASEMARATNQNVADVREVVFRLDGAEGKPSVIGVAANCESGAAGVAVALSLSGRVPQPGAPVSKPAIGMQVGKKILEALGLGGLPIVGLSLSFEAHGAVVATVRRLVTVEECEKIVGPLATLGSEHGVFFRGQVGEVAKEIRLG